jgi:hypothetical protein
MECFDSSFYSATLAAGAILTGFCGTFLTFRLTRESNYYRNPNENPSSNGAVKAADKSEETTDSKPTDKASEENKEKNQTHFTAPLLLLLCATSSAAIFGFLFPLVALAMPNSTFGSAKAIIGGEIISLIFLAGYFLGELVHYDVFKILAGDEREWLRQIPILLVTFFVAVSALIVWISQDIANTPKQPAIEKCACQRFSTPFCNISAHQISIPMPPTSLNPVKKHLQKQTK